MPQKHQTLISELERLTDGHKNRVTKKFSPGLKDVLKEIGEVERNLFELKKEQLTKASEAAKDDKDVDKTIGDFNKKIDAEKTRLENLQIKRVALETAVQAKEREFAEWELKKLKEQEEGLGPRFLKAIKVRDEAEKELETAQAEVQNVQFLRLDVRRKVDGLKKELAVPEKPLTAEEKEETRQRSEYERRAQSVFKQVDDELLLLLSYESGPERRLEKLRTLRTSQAGMINKIVFPWKLKRPPNRPDPFEGFRDEQIARVTYPDACKLRHGSPQEKEGMRKKYLS